MTWQRRPSEAMRVGINLLTDDPAHPSGAHWFWTRIIPEMGRLLEGDEELHLLVSRASRPTHQGYGPGVRYLPFPWSNEHPRLRTLSEHVYAPLRLPSAGIDVFSTLIAPLVRPAPGLVAHFKTMHAFTAPEAIRPEVRLYRQLSYPRTARVADAIILNSESLRTEVLRHLDVDPAKLRLIPEAVDHELFRPGDAERSRRLLEQEHGVSGPFVLFVSSLWPYKNAEGLIRAFALARPELAGHRLVMVGSGRDPRYLSGLHSLADDLGIADDVVWVGGVPLEDTVHFYRAADVFVYPSFNETFGLPILEAMACACPVVTSGVSAMPETAGDAALLADPHDPASIARAIVDACGPDGQLLRKLGPERAGQFTWAETARRTLAVYREVHAARREQG
jgi:glycosyltransferase involved in cell wall biosynthesis